MYKSKASRWYSTVTQYHFKFCFTSHVKRKWKKYKKKNPADENVKLLGCKRMLICVTYGIAFRELFFEKIYEFTGMAFRSKQYLLGKWTSIYLCCSIYFFYCNIYKIFEEGTPLISITFPCVYCYINGIF